eukprot:Protomagalhaensia_sp_Gyna_25__2940@NODE_2726_length_924_cov_401_369492_g2273_i0_p1_GENE_NODE_2726_length_924_cov_401_369492_g2273_i0NODE_2726_length_924_cov_401_369492_g2273_i0_p1_ORF_typecomplete_len228_score30_09Motile_Sperm/PF00635_26/8_7e25PapDlike/PF14874_6/0_0044_NODE_2726_length_924_cov_401_369492_g2273_i0133816
MSETTSSILKFQPDRVLEFNVFGGSQSQVYLNLDNPGDNYVAFKIKTTAPKSYLVKPSSGIVYPRSKQQVSILLIPLYEAPREASPDRFLVQSTIVNSPEPLTKEAWSELSNDKEKLVEKRLSVNLNWLGFSSGYTSSKTDMSDALHNIIKQQPQEGLDLKKYEELIAYSIAADKRIKDLEAQNDELKSKSGTTNADSVPKAGGSMEYWQVALLLLFVIVALRTFPI